MSRLAGSAHATASVAYGENSRSGWSGPEDELLANLVKNDAAGTSHAWSRIAEDLAKSKLGPLRTGKQCRARWLNYLNPEVCRDPWTSQEEALLFEAHAKYGNKWALIAQHLPGRSDNMIKNHWYSTLRRTVRKIQHGLVRDTVAACAGAGAPATSAGSRDPDVADPPSIAVAATGAQQMERSSLSGASAMPHMVEVTEGLRGKDRRSSAATASAASALVHEVIERASAEDKLAAAKPCLAAAYGVLHKTISEAADQSGDRAEPRQPKKRGCRPQSATGSALDLKADSSAASALQALASALPRSIALVLEQPKRGRYSGSVGEQSAQETDAAPATSSAPGGSQHESPVGSVSAAEALFSLGSPANPGKRRHAGGAAASTDVASGHGVVAKRPRLDPVGTRPPPSLQSPTDQGAFKAGGLTSRSDGGAFALPPASAVGASATVGVRMAVPGSYGSGGRHGGVLRPKGKHSLGSSLSASIPSDGMTLQLAPSAAASVVASVGHSSAMPHSELLSSHGCGLSTRDGAGPNTGVFDNSRSDCTSGSSACQRSSVAPDGGRPATTLPNLPMAALVAVASAATDASASQSSASTKPRRRPPPSLSLSASHGDSHPTSAAASSYSMVPLMTMAPHMKQFDFDNATGSGSRAAASAAATSAAGIHAVGSNSVYAAPTHAASPAQASSSGPRAGVAPGALPAGGASGAPTGRSAPRSSAVMSFMAGASEPLSLLPASLNTPLQLSALPTPGGPGGLLRAPSSNHPALGAHFTF